MLMRKILLLLILGTVISAQQLILTEDTISTKVSLNTSPLLVKDTKGKIHFVYSIHSNLSKNSEEIFYSFKDNDSIRTENLTNDGLENNYPCLALDKYDNAFITFLSKDTTNNVFQIKFTSNVRGYFTEPKIITTDRTNKLMPVNVIDPDSVLHIAYYSNIPEKDQIYYISYNLKTEKTSKPLFLGTGKPVIANDISMVIDKKGRVHIAVKTGQSEGGELKYFQVVKGKIQEVPTGIEQKVVSPRLLIDRFNAVYILYKNVKDNRLYLINNFGGNFKEPVAITPLYQNPTDYFHFAIDDRERLCFVYASKDYDNYTSLYLIHGTGKQFSNSIKIQDFPNDKQVLTSVNILAEGNGQLSLLLSKKFQHEKSSELILKEGYLFGYPAAHLDKDSLNFPSIAPGDSCTAYLSIKNTGKALLKIFSPVIYAEVYSTDIADTLLIQPNATEYVHIKFCPIDTVEYVSTIIFKTNSLTTKTIKATLIGKGLGLPRLFASKDTLTLMNGKAYADSLIIINKGVSVLKIDSVKSFSGYSFNIFYNKSEIEPRDSIYLKISLNEQSDEIAERFIDSILVYTNDPHKRISKFIVHSQHYTLNIDKEKTLNDLFRLQQNYPNPFNPQTTITFTISNQAYVKLYIFDALAREITTLVDENLSAGIHNVVFNGENLATGVYYYKLQVKSNDRKQPDYVDVKKMILVK
jgi:hypothetical protein